MSLLAEYYPQMTREAMRNMKAKTDEKNRIAQVNQFVSEIYRNATEAAKTKDTTFYGYPVDGKDAFIIKNLPDIIQGLQSIFSDCSVDYKMMAQSIRGQLYDVSKMDPTSLSLIGNTRLQESIMIDWS